MAQVQEKNIQPVKLFSNSYTPSKKTSDIPIILIHGLFASHRTWNPVQHMLGDTTERTIISYDLRNHGKSGYDNENIADLESEAIDLKNFMDTKEIPSAIMIGHSIGSRVAMHFALNYESRVEMLLVEDMCVTLSDAHKAAYRSMAKCFKLGYKFFRTFPSFYTEEEAHKKIMNFFLEDMPEIADEISRVNLQVPLHKDHKTKKIVWDINTEVAEVLETKEIYEIDLKNNKTYNKNVLFLYGDSSVMNLDHDKDVIKKIFPNAQYQNFENGIHVFHQDNPELFVKIVNDFINSKQEKLPNSLNTVEY